MKPVGFRDGFPTLHRNQGCVDCTDANERITLVCFRVFRRNAFDYYTKKLIFMTSIFLLTISAETIIVDMSISCHTSFDT